MAEQWDQNERRHYIRIEKQFIISYYEKDRPKSKYDISQLRNISVGGICFVASHEFKAGTQLCIDLKTPYFSGITQMEGEVLEATERIPGMIYETRLIFHDLNPEAKVVLEKIVETFSKIRDE